MVPARTLGPVVPARSRPGPGHAGRARAWARPGFDRAWPSQRILHHAKWFLHTMESFRLQHSHVVLNIKHTVADGFRMEAHTDLQCTNSHLLFTPLHIHLSDPFRIFFEIMYERFMFENSCISSSSILISSLFDVFLEMAFLASHAGGPPYRGVPTAPGSFFPKKEEKGKR